MAEFPARIKAKNATLANRWTALQQQASSVVLLRSTFHGDLARSSLWRDVLSRYGIDGVASAVFTDQSGCRGFRDLWRDDSREPFSAADYIASLIALLTKALRRSQTRT
jgi:hypothetical protein